MTFWIPTDFQTPFARKYLTRSLPNCGVGPTSQPIAPTTRRPLLSEMINLPQVTHKALRAASCDMMSCDRLGQGHSVTLTHHVVFMTVCIRVDSPVRDPESNPPFVHRGQRTLDQSAHTLQSGEVGFVPKSAHRRGDFVRSHIRGLLNQDRRRSQAIWRLLIARHFRSQLSTNAENM